MLYPDYVACELPAFCRHSAHPSSTASLRFVGCSAAGGTPLPLSLSQSGCVAVARRPRRERDFGAALPPRFGRLLVLRLAVAKAQLLDVEPCELVQVLLLQKAAAQHKRRRRRLQVRAVALLQCLDDVDGADALPRLQPAARGDAVELLDERGGDPRRVRRYVARVDAGGLVPAEERLLVERDDGDERAGRLQVIQIWTIGQRWA